MRDLRVCVPVFVHPELAVVGGDTFVGRHPGVSAMAPEGTVRWWAGAGAIESARHFARSQLKARRGTPGDSSALQVQWVGGDAEDVYILGLDDGLGVLDATWNLQVRTCQSINQSINQSGAGSMSG